MEKKRMNIAKTLLKRKFRGKQAYIRKQEKSQVKESNFTPQGINKQAKNET